MNTRACYRNQQWYRSCKTFLYTWKEKRNSGLVHHLFSFLVNIDALLNKQWAFSKSLFYCWRNAHKAKKWRLLSTIWLTFLASRSFKFIGAIVRVWIRSSHRTSSTIFTRSWFARTHWKLDDNQDRSIKVSQCMLNLQTIDKLTCTNLFHNCRHKIPRHTDNCNYRLQLLYMFLHFDKGGLCTDLLWYRKRNCEFLFIGT